MSAVPWENEEKRNYICMDHIVNNIVSEELRNLFKQEWNKRYQTSFGPWDDTNISGQQLYNLELTRSRPSKNVYQSKFQNGDTNQWDCSVLFDAILYSNSIGATLNPTIKKEVDSLRIIRNDTKHYTGELSDTEFQTMANDVENAFKSLGISINEITRLKVEKNLYKNFQCLPPKPTHEVVYRNEMIAEICQKLQKLHSDNSGQLTYFYISGNPGSGKSQLARQVCENICENVFSPTETTFVMTLNGKDLNSLHNSYEDFCRRLNCDGSILESILKSRKSPDEKIKDLRSQIETRIRSRQRWLLVVDNVENFQDISCLLPQTGNDVWKNGQIILTTQNTTNVPPDSSFTKHVSLSLGMNDQECRHLLSSVSGTDLNNPLLDEVAEQLDRQPLAIAAAAIYFKRLKPLMSEFSWRDFLKKLNRERKTTEKELSKISIAYTSTMTTAVLLAVEKSAESDFVLKHIFQFLSLVSFEEMPLELIGNYVEQMNVNVDKHEICLTACQCSLFLLSESDDRYVRLHRVVHEAIKFYCNGGEREIESSSQYRSSKNRPGVDVLAEIRGAVRTLFCFQERKDQDKLIPHLKEFNRAVKNLFPPNEALYLVASAFNNKYEISMIFLFFGYNLNNFFCSQLSIEYQKANLRLSLEQNISFCDAILSCLGDSYDILGQWAKAIEFYEQALEWCTILTGPSHPRTATSLSNLGNLYGKTGEWEKAKKIQAEALEIRRKILGTDHPHTAASLNNLGNLYEETGETERAKQIIAEALEIFRKKLGPDHPVTAGSLNNLGNLYNKTGEWERAKKFHEEALEIKKKKLGPDHPDTAASLNNLANVFEETGEWEKAEKFHKEALEIKRKQLEPDHPDTAASLNNLGNLFKKIGEGEKAEKFLKEALEIKRKKLGPDHPGTAASLNNLGNLYVTTGEWKKAKNFFAEALEIRREKLGADHPITAASFNNLGSLCEITAEWEKAKNFHAEALEIRRKKLGPDHPDTAQSLNNLGNLYKSTGEWEKAKKFYAEALEILGKKFSPDHPYTAASLNGLGNLYMRTGEWGKAKKIHAESLEIRRKKLGPDHLDTAESLNDLGNLYMTTGEWDAMGSFGTPTGRL